MFPPATEKLILGATLPCSNYNCALHCYDAHLAAIDGIKSGGATAFAPPCRQLAHDYDRSVVGEALREAGGGLQQDKLLETTYVNFDTDGGHNTGECYKAVRAMVGAWA